MPEGVNATITSQELNGSTAALLAGRNGGYDGDYTWKGAAAGALCDLREAVAQSRSDVREAIATHGSAMAAGFTHVGEKACSAEKEAIRAQYEGKLQTIQSAKEVEEAVNGVERALTDKLSNFERSTADRFCSVEKLVMSEGNDTRAKLAECCCEIKESFGSLERRQNEQFCKLSEQHIKQVLTETQDELAKARLDGVVAQLSKGNN